MIFVLIGLGLIGFLPMIVLLVRKRNADRLVKFGSTTDAVVKMIRGFSIRLPNPIDIEYTVKETGQTISKTILVAGSPYSVGDKLPIYYDPKNPRKTQFSMKKSFIPMF